MLNSNWVLLPMLPVSRPIRCFKPLLQKLMKNLSIAKCWLPGMCNFWWSSSKTDGPRGVTPASETDLDPWPAPFDQPFYLLLNLAVGGRFPGHPDNQTVFPAEMIVDYVRVYRKIAGAGKPAPRGPGPLPFDSP